MLVAVALTLAPPVVFGGRWPDYSAVRDYISELGAGGAPDAAAVNLSFAIAGVAVVWACGALGQAVPVLRRSLWLVAAIGVSYIVAALAPCDAGCPADGSSRQMFHNISGAVGYLTGGTGLLLAGRALAANGRPVLAWGARLAGVMAVGGLVAMGAPELADVRGLTQRLVEVAAFTWLLAMAAATRRGLVHPER